MISEFEPPAPRLPVRDAPRDTSLEAACKRVRPGGFAPRAPAPTPTVLDGRYRLLYRLGAGGIGEVWCAEHVGIGKRVAIKFLQSSLARQPRVRRRFLREARLAASVRHPSVVDMFDVGELGDGRVYLAMELIEGRTIAEVVAREGPFAWPRAREVLAELAAALAHAHACGVIHRDIKPSNVMLVDAREDGSGRCKLIDFGLARGEGAGASVEVTTSGAVMGSPAYMSPEQFRGARVDVRSDIYGFGCLAHFVLTGRPPFDGATATVQMYQHLMVPFPRLADDALHAWLSKACHKDRSRRYVDMDEVLATMPAADGRTGTRTRVGLAAGVALLGLLLPADGLQMRNAPAASIPPRPTAEPNVVSEPSAHVETVASVHAGMDFTCALTSAGRVRCWGVQGPHLCQPRHLGNVGDDEAPHAVPLLDFGQRRAVGLDIGFLSSHACALLDDGSVRCWGSDAFGQLGLGPGISHWCDGEGESLATLASLDLPRVHAIDTQQLTTCALAGDRGALWCWGGNTHGQLGLGHVDTLEQPPRSPIELGGARVAQVSVGVANVCALLDDGHVRCWGGNRNLHLGSGWPTDRRVGDGVGDGLIGALPNASSLDVRDLDDFEVALVRANGGWNCVMSVDSRVRCWGGNDDGAMGYRHDQIPDCDAKRNGYDCLMPTPRLDLELGALAGATLVDLQMGRKHACVLDDRGAVRCWGWGVGGSLGYGGELVAATGHAGIGHHRTPAEAYAAMGNEGVVDIGDFNHDGAIDRVEALTMGYAHTCVLVADGSVRCWGRNSEGQLGYGTTEDIGDDETPAQYYATHECGAVPILAGQGCTTSVQ